MKDEFNNTPVQLKDPSDVATPIIQVDDTSALPALEDQVRDAISQKISEALSNLPDGWADDEPSIAQSARPRHMQGLGLDFPQANNNTLPVLVSQELSPITSPGLKWRKVGKMPGFVDPRIRKLGRMVFESFPCYRAYAERCKEQGLDPHAEVLTISDLSNGMTDVQFIAGIITKNFRMIDKGVIDYGQLLPEYNPDIGLFMTKSWTFKLVRDRKENGAPIDANYIYAWPGGYEYYQPKSISQDNLPALSNE